jgi:hypothetical protein
LRCNSETFRNFAQDIQLKYVFVMARPIKETPILYGEDARRFEARMKERRHIVFSCPTGGAGQQ